MPIIRAKHEQEYYVAANATANDSSLSYKARGILAYLLSKPDDWKVLLSDLVSQSTDGERSIRSGLGELLNLGYAQRKAVRDANGRFLEWEYTIYEIPLSQNSKMGYEPDCQNSIVDSTPTAPNPKSTQTLSEEQEFEKKRQEAIEKVMNAYPAGL